METSKQSGGIRYYFQIGCENYHHHVIIYYVVITVFLLCPHLMWHSYIVLASHICKTFLKNFNKLFSKNYPLFVPTFIFHQNIKINIVFLLLLYLPKLIYCNRLILPFCQVLPWHISISIVVLGWENIGWRSTLKGFITNQLISGKIYRSIYSKVSTFLL